MSEFNASEGGEEAKPSVGEQAKAVVGKVGEGASAAAGKVGEVASNVGGAIAGAANFLFASTSEVAKSGVEGGKDLVGKISGEHMKNLVTYLTDVNAKFFGADPALLHDDYTFRNEGQVMTKDDYINFSAKFVGLGWSQSQTLGKVTDLEIFTGKARGSYAFALTFSLGPFPSGAKWFSGEDVSGKVVEGFRIFGTVKLQQGLVIAHEQRSDDMRKALGLVAAKPSFASKE